MSVSDVAIQDFQLHGLPRFTRNDSQYTVIARSVSDVAIHEVQLHGLPRFAFHEQSRHCERSEAIHDFQLHGLPRFARSDEASV